MFYQVLQTTNLTLEPDDAPEQDVHCSTGVTETLLSGACWSPCSVIAVVMLQPVFPSHLQGLWLHLCDHLASTARAIVLPACGLGLDLPAFPLSSDSGHCPVPAMLLQPCFQPGLWSKPEFRVAVTSTREICPISITDITLDSKVYL